MKRVAILSVLLLVLAGSGAAWELTMVPAQQEMPGGSDSSQPDTLLYDTGGTFFISGPTNLWGCMTMTAPANFEVRCLYLQMSNPNGNSDGVTVYLYDDDGQGEPGSIISGPYDFDGPLWMGGAWLDIELDQPYPQISGGDNFFVVFGPAPMGSSSEGWFLLTDRFNNYGRAAYSTAHTGPWAYDLPGEFIVRAGGEIDDYTDLAVTCCYNDIEQYFLETGDEVTYKADVMNVGSLDVGIYRLIWTVQNASGTQVFADSMDCYFLVPGETASYTCPNPWTATAAGEYTATARVSQVDDVVIENNTFSLEQGVDNVGNAWFDYDDGDPDSQIIGISGVGWGNKFHLPSHPVRVDSVQVGVGGDTQYSDVRLVTFVGFIGTDIWTYDGPLSDGINTFDLSGEALNVYVGDLGLAYYYQTGAPILKDDDAPLAGLNTKMPYVSNEVTGQSWTPIEEGDWILRVYCSGDVAVEPETGHDQPQAFRMVGVYPNPFNPNTVISYQLSVVSVVNLSVYDIQGRQVAELVDGRREAGRHDVTFDGSGLPSGIYIYRLTAGKFTSMGKMVLLK